MNILSSTHIGVQQGDVNLFSDFEHEGEMWTGKGARERRKKVSFDQTFRKEPSVFVSLSMWDIDHSKTARADISAENITDKGFDIVFRTWGDTRIARARAGWMAVGAVTNDDDWELY